MRPRYIRKRIEQSAEIAALQHPVGCTRVEGPLPHSLVVVAGENDDACIRYDAAQHRQDVDAVGAVDADVQNDRVGALPRGSVNRRATTGGRANGLEPVIQFERHLEKSRELRHVLDDEHLCRSQTSSPDGRWCVFGFDGAIKVVDATTGKDAASIAVVAGSAWWSEDGASLAVLGRPTENVKALLK